MRVVEFYPYVCGIVLISQSYGQQANSTPLTARFLNEAPEGWKRLESKHRQTRFDWNETATNNFRERKVDTRSGSNCYRGEDFLIRTKAGGRASTTTWGGNDRYLFAVKKTGDESAWSIASFGARSDNRTVNGDNHGSGIFTRIPWYIFSRPLDALISDPTFKIHSIKERAEGSVEVRFSLIPQSYDSRYPEISSGRVVLLPDRDWAISEYEAKLTRRTRPDDPPVFVSATVTYGPEEDTFLNLKGMKHELKWRLSRGKQRGEQRWILSEREFACQQCEEPAESFQLAAFGLSEPALPSDRVRLTLWLNVAAVVCLLLAWLWSRRKAPEV